ncbi:MAG TPA: GAF domain-containing protein [Candidatus Cybelea sp.]|nr:GAF domain-containing protein [Candidatus Cybelea sp.]
MIGTGNRSRPPAVGYGGETANGNSAIPAGTEELRVRVQQLSLREQIERNHFLLMRLNAANARLIQSLDHGDVFEAIAEIIANLMGCEEIAVFDYHPEERTFSLAWSSGVEAAELQPFLTGAGMFGRAVQQGLSQFQERQAEGVLLPHEKNLTACVILKSSGEIVGVIAIFGLLPQKSNLEWADFELLKFLEIYGAVAIKFQRLQGKQVAP